MRRYFQIPLLMILLLGINGCKKVVEEAGQTGLCPIVVSSIPTNLATNVPLTSAISVTFNEPVNPLSITDSVFIVRNGVNVISGTLSYNDSTSVFTPDEDLLPETTYSVTISAGVTDAANNAMINDYVFSFTTGVLPDIINPFVISTFPAPGATGVAVDAIITATFSEVMSVATITESSYTLSLGDLPISGSVSYSGITASFDPDEDLLEGLIYTASISIVATDLAGNPLLIAHTWDFIIIQPVIPIPDLRTIELFGVFGGTAGITNQGLFTVVNNGGIGTTGVSTLVTGFHDGITEATYTETPLNVGNATGGVYTAPPLPGSAGSLIIATLARNDAFALYGEISPASMPGGVDPGDGELGGLTLAPGVYKSASGTFDITNSDLTLDAMNDPNAVFVFQCDAALTVGIAGPTGARSIVLINGAKASNVFWWVGSAATINGAGGGVMVGNILSSAGSTFSTAGNAELTTLNGRAISLNASVTMVNTIINVPQ
ncbi:MAG: ice-binding family protein [Chitinophagaceae bacterium]